MKLAALMTSLLLMTTLTCADDAPTTSTAPKYLLRYQFKPGQFVHFEVETSTSTSIVAKEFKQTLKESCQSKKHFRVVSVASDGSAVLEPIIDHVAMTIQNDDDEPIKFDSATTETPSRKFKPLKDSIGQPLLRMRYQPTGAAVEVLQIAGQNRKISTDPQQHTFLTVFPDQPIEVGHVWTQDFGVPVDVKLTENRTGRKTVMIRRRYQLKEVKDDIAVVEFRIYPLDLIREPEQLAQLVQRTLNGTLRFDLKSGQQIELTSTGAGHVHGAIGPDSSLSTTAKNYERVVNHEPIAKK